MKRAVIPVLLVFLMLTGCTPAEKWAYIHEPGKAVLSVHGDTAVFGNKKYSVSPEDDKIVMTASDGETVWLETNETGATLYVPSVFIREGEGEGLTGVWKCPEKNSSFSFNDKGEFTEDNVFGGTYTADGTTFRLTYEAYFQDTVCSYSLADDKLVVSYPWPMVKAGK